MKTSAMSALLAALLLIGPLIFFHELGHLIAAKMVGVKVTRFSIGFGRPFARAHLGETEYCLAPIPLGGYVMMLGQHPGDDIPATDADRALGAKSLWARAFVMAAGPIANLLLPLAILFFFFLSHTLTSPPVVGTVFPDSAAESAGLESGDRIVAVEGSDIRSFRELQRAIGPHPDEELRVQIEREGSTFDRFITPRRRVSKDQFGIENAVGVLGIGLHAYAPQIGIVDTDSPAYQAGLRTGDIITSVRGEPLEPAEDLEEIRVLDSAARLHVTFLRPRAADGPIAEFVFYENRDASLVPSARNESQSGILPAGTFIRAVESGSPAQQAGILPGDRVIGMMPGGEAANAEMKRLTRWEELATLLARRGVDAPVDLIIQTPGEDARRVQLQQVNREIQTVYNSAYEYAWHGLEPFTSVRVPPAEPIRGRITYAAEAAWDRTIEASGFVLGALRRLIFKPSEGLADIGSVVGIAHMASVAAERGPSEFIRLAAILSINLGFLNLLPIPILDGGHLLFYLIEAVRRRPLSQRGREIASGIGFLILGMLMLVALRNDIMRIWFN
jgi:regulator of sigma E protease